VKKLLAILIIISFLLFPYGDILAALNTYSIDLESTSSQYVYANDSTDLSPTAAITLEAWSKREDATSIMMIVGKMDSATQRTYYLYTGATVIGYEISQDGATTDRQYGSATWTADTNWHHIAFTFNCSTQTPIIYLDGTPLSTSSTGNATAIFDSTSAFVIGFDVVDNNYYFDGKIDEVRVWSDVRTQTEIQDNDQLQLNGNEANLVGYWMLNNNAEDKGETTDPAGSIADDLTLVNTPVYSTDVPFVGAGAGGAIIVPDVIWW